MTVPFDSWFFAIVCHFVLPGKMLSFTEPPLGKVQIRQNMCNTLFVGFSNMAMNDQVTVNPPVPDTILKLRV